VRLEKDGQFVELWLAQPPAYDGRYHSPELWQRSSSQPEPVTLAVTSAWAALRELDRIMAEHLRAGWRRVRDLEREVDVDNEPRDPALDAALLSDPGDAHAALVYADWLQQRGHPRGALIAVQHARLDRPDDAELAAEEARILDEHGDDLLGPLDRGKSLELHWERGFVRRARIGRDDGDDGPQALWETLRHPSARFLRELVIGCHKHGDQNNELMCDLLMAAEPHPPLRLLEIADFDQSEIDNIDISRAPIGDLSRLSELYPRLEDVVLKGNGDARLGDLRLLHARRFAYRTSQLTRATLATITRAPWPALEELELWFGDPDAEYGAECELADAEQLLGCELPKLRSLALRNAMFSDEVVPAIVAWRGAAQLEELDFALGTLSDDGADRLIAERHRLPKLRRLGVFECALSLGGLERLRDAGLPVDDRAIAPKFEWREPHQKTGRYASVSE
jgi:uncharacterized protein (TIGR02996 family)